MAKWNRLESFENIEEISDFDLFQVTLIVANRLKPIDSELQEVKENELKSENIDLALENLKIPSV
jgi:hypothetical protein